MNHKNALVSSGRKINLVFSLFGAFSFFMMANLNDAKATLDPSFNEQIGASVEGAASDKALQKRVKWVESYVSKKAQEYVVGVLNQIEISPTSKNFDRLTQLKNQVLGQDLGLNVSHHKSDYEYLLAVRPGRVRSTRVSVNVAGVNLSSKNKNYLTENVSASLVVSSILKKDAKGVERVSLFIPNFGVKPENAPAVELRSVSTKNVPLESDLEEAKSFSYLKIRSRLDKNDPLLIIQHKKEPVKEIPGRPAYARAYDAAIEAWTLSGSKRVAPYL